MNWKGVMPAITTCFFGSLPVQLNRFRKISSSLFLNESSLI